MNLDLEQITAAARAALEHTGASVHPWERVGTTVFQLEHHGWRRGEEQLHNLFSARAYAVSKSPEAQLAIAEHMVRSNPTAVLALVERLERAERISPYAFWFTGVDEFDDLCPAEVLAGACIAQRTEAPTPAQRRTLELTPVERFKKLVAYAAKPIGEMG